MEEECCLVLEVEKRAWEEAKHLACKEATKKVQEEAEQKAQEEAERRAEEECKVQEAVARAKEEAEREEAVWRATEAAKERANAERRALEERLWKTVGQCLEMAVAPPQVAKPSRRMMVVGPSAPAWKASGVQDPCMRCCNKGTLCILGTAKGKTMACKVGCSWSKKMVGESRKWKWVWRSEEVEEIEGVNVDEDEDEKQLHFAVLQHLMEEHQDTLRALTMTLDTLSTDFLAFQQDSWNIGMSILRAMEAIADELQQLNDLKEEEMGKSKGKGKEKAKEEFRRSRMDDDGDMEMGGAGPSLLA
ncbi:hypothetical protein ID866_11609 [Astraeus odoratus]|nr:hypothetical protein ID866_11609 [Astraeus odoratus]